jgi:hypothetical protein
MHVLSFGLRDSGTLDRRRASKSRVQAQGISLAMWPHHPCSHHHPPTLIYFFFTPLLSPARDGAPPPSRLVVWHTWLAPTLTNPPVAGSSPGRGITSQNWSWEIIRKRGGCRFLPTWRGWFLLLFCLGKVEVYVCVLPFISPEVKSNCCPPRLFGVVSYAWYCVRPS